MIVNLSGFRIFNADAVHQIDDTPIGYNVIEYMVRLHRKHQRAEFHLIEGIMGNTLLENHLGVQLSGTGQNHLPRLYTKGGGDTLQARQSAFLIADIPASVCKLHGSLGHQLNNLRILLGIALAAPDRKYHCFSHSKASTASFSSSSISSR